MATTLGKIIQYLREEKDLDQKELAEKIGVSYSVMNRIELGTRPARDEELKKIAEVLDVSVDYLLGRSDIRNPYTEVDEFLLKLKEEAKKQGVDFDETSPQELIETYKLLLEFRKKTKSN